MSKKQPNRLETLIDDLRQKIHAILNEVRNDGDESRKVDANAVYWEAERAKYALQELEEECKRRRKIPK